MFLINRYHKEVEKYRNQVERSNAEKNGRNVVVTCEKSTYTLGQTVQGRVVFPSTLINSLQLQDCKLSLLFSCYTRVISHYEGGGENSSSYPVYWTPKTYFDIDIDIDMNAAIQILGPNCLLQHTVPFSFQIPVPEPPTEFPSSIDVGSVGGVYYGMSFTLKCGEKLVATFFETVDVKATHNHLPNAADGTVVEKSIKVASAFPLCCLAQGTLDVKLSTDRLVFSADQPLVMKLEVTNKEQNLQLFQRLKELKVEVTGTIIEQRYKYFCPVRKFKLAGCACVVKIVDNVVEYVVPVPRGQQPSFIGDISSKNARERDPLVWRYEMKVFGVFSGRCCRVNFGTFPIVISGACQQHEVVVSRDLSTAGMLLPQSLPPLGVMSNALQQSSSNGGAGGVQADVYQATVVGTTAANGDYTPVQQSDEGIVMATVVSVRAV